MPQLLFNSECWISISRESLQELENLQLRIYRTLFAVGIGCPVPVLYWETGGTMMKYRILRKKLLFLHHVATLPVNTLAREVYETQKRLHLPGLIQECDDFMVKNDVTNLCNFSACQWKNFVKRKIADMNAKDILCQMEHYKKINKEDFDDKVHQVQQYLKDMNVAEARLRFKIRSLMTPTIRMNFQNDAVFRQEMWMCPGCNNRIDTQAHVMKCPAYSQLRENKDLSNDKDLVAYFANVVKLRVV